MAPLKSTAVFPTGWAEHHRPVALASMTSRCELFLLGERTGLDEAPETITHNDLPCRVQQLNRANDTVAAGRETQTREYLLTVPYTVQALTGSRGHRARITESGDPHLIGRVFTITQIMYGSEIWERDLICTDDMGVEDG